MVEFNILTKYKIIKSVYLYVANSKIFALHFGFNGRFISQFSSVVNLK